MLALLSPAKMLDFDRPIPSVQATTAAFAGEAERIAAAAAKLSAKKLGALMHISPKLAGLNAERFRGFTEQPERPAIYAFAGDVYVGFEVRSLEPEAVDYAQGHIRILSGLYGLLRPLDAIRAYRLEMGTKWAPGRPKDLYALWGRRIGDLLAAELAEQGTDTLVNLASREYWGAVETAPPTGARIVTIDFREQGPDGLRFNSFPAKRARGMMARWICEHRIDRAEGLAGFDSDGYRFTPAGSSETMMRFVRG